MVASYSVTSRVFSSQGTPTPPSKMYTEPDNRDYGNGIALRSSLPVVQSFCHQGKQLVRQGEFFEDQYRPAIR